LPLDEVSHCNRFATGGLSPHATVLLELNPSAGAARQRAAGKVFDRMELEDGGFHARVARGYADLADRVEGVVRVDAEGSVEAVHRRVLAALEGALGRNFR
jgi:dTMP kinase